MGSLLAPSEYTSRFMTYKYPLRADSMLRRTNCPAAKGDSVDTRSAVHSLLSSGSSGSWIRPRILTASELADGRMRRSVTPTIDAPADVPLDEVPCTVFAGPEGRSLRNVFKMRSRVRVS